MGVQLTQFCGRIDTWTGIKNFPCLWINTFFCVRSLTQVHVNADHCYLDSTNLPILKVDVDDHYPSI
jgi:hypothetical protein